MTDQARWEYKTVTLDARARTDQTEQQLNNYGTGGWELAAVTRFSFETIAYFKRIKPGRAALAEGGQHE